MKRIISVFVISLSLLGCSEPQLNSVSSKQMGPYDWLTCDDLPEPDTRTYARVVRCENKEAVCYFTEAYTGQHISCFKKGAPNE